MAETEMFFESESNMVERESIYKKADPILSGQKR